MMKKKQKTLVAYQHSSKNRPGQRIYAISQISNQNEIQKTLELWKLFVKQSQSSNG